VGIIKTVSAYLRRERIPAQGGTMKKKMLVAAVLILMSLPVFAGFRLDIGLEAPISAGATNGTSGIGTSIGDIPFLPIPEIAIYYLWDIGPVNLGLGLRAYSIILESVAWPNLVAEFNLGPFVIQAQLGGGFFAAFGAAGNATAFGQVAIPDLSAWFKFGKTEAFRLGGGIMGFYAPAALGSNSIIGLFYLGGKVALEL
jgi:hypothetical protein